jgi:hypothetical protein
MAALAENYCLRWNDYGPNITEGLRALREDKDFFDVTLACEDAHIPAHKVVLSACSPFFKNIFRRHEHQHPLLYLKVGQASQKLTNYRYRSHRKQIRKC